MNSLVIIVGKIIIKLMQLLGKNGSALPGLIAEKVRPSLLESMLGSLPEGVVVITGTNGKTTTTKATTFLIEQCGLRVLSNKTGSNFTRGIYASIINNSTWTGSLPYDIAVLELDEAYSRVFAHRVQPRVVLALNVMRDQLDRYGELSTTAAMISETISLASEGAVLNLDDPMVARMASDAPGSVSYFGLKQSLRSQLPSDEALHDVTTDKSAKKPKKSKASKRPVAAVELATYKPGSASYRIDGKSYHTRLKANGIHNAYNFAAALAVTMRVCKDMEPQFLVPAVGAIDSAFGRGESVEIAGKALTISLVKNPSGFVQSMKSFSGEHYDVTLFAINDNYADGRDVSWLWDVAYDSINNTRVFTSGERASDMALRLSYDSIEAEQVTESLSNALDAVIEATSDKAILYCTYTAMLEIRKLLAAKTQMEDVWRNK